LQGLVSLDGAIIRDGTLPTQGSLGFISSIGSIGYISFINSIGFIGYIG